MQALDSVASASLTNAKLPRGASLNFTRKFASLSRRDGNFSALNKNIKSPPDSRRFTRLLVRSDGETFPREIAKAAGAATELFDEVEGLAIKSREYTQWDDITQKLTLSSTLAGLFLMAPQVRITDDLCNVHFALGSRSYMIGSLDFVKRTIPSGHHALSSVPPTPRSQRTPPRSPQAPPALWPSYPGPATAPASSATCFSSPTL